MTNYSIDEIKELVFSIQNEWATNIVKIGKAYLEKKNHIKITEEFLDKLYFLHKLEIMFGNFSCILVKLSEPFSNKIPIKFIHTSDLAINSSIFGMLNIFVSTISKYPGFA